MAEAVEVEWAEGREPYRVVESRWPSRRWGPIGASLY